MSPTADEMYTRLVITVKAGRHAEETTLAFVEGAGFNTTGMALVEAAIEVLEGYRAGTVGVPKVAERVEIG